MKFLALLSALALRADTITTRDSRSWNGRVTGGNGALTLSAGFRPGPRTLIFPSEYLRIVEFNAATFNPGAPPPSLPPVKGGRLGGTIVFRERNRKESGCADIAITGDTVRCGSAAFKRDDVLRIIFSR